MDGTTRFGDATYMMGIDAIVTFWGEILGAVGNCSVSPTPPTKELSAAADYRWRRTGYG